MVIFICEARKYKPADSVSLLTLRVRCGVPAFAVADGPHLLLCALSSAWAMLQFAVVSAKDHVGKLLS
jgi:hypothetical protein